MPEGLFVYEGNRDEGDGTTVLHLNSGPLPLGGKGVFTADEYDYFNLHFYLTVPGISPRGSSSLEILESWGHSVSAGSLLPRGDRDSYVEKVAHALGARRRSNRGWSGAVACWPQAGISGDGGMTWMGQTAVRPGMASVTERVAPYVSRSQLVNLGYGINDIPRLGGAKPRPFIEAMRVMMHRVCAAGVWKHDAAAWAFTGTWATTVSSNLYPSGDARYSTTVGDSALWTGPVDYPGNRVIGIVMGVIGATAYTMTIGVQIDGVVREDFIIDSSTMRDSENTKHGLCVLRLDPADYPALQIAGAHTVRLSLKSVVGVVQPWTIDSVAIEADPLDGPVIHVPSIHRCVDYTAYTVALPHWPGAANDPITDASVNAFNAAIEDLLDEFPGRTIFSDIDGAVNKNPTLFLADKLHLNVDGHALMAQVIHETVLQSKLMTSRLLTKSIPDPDVFWEPIGTTGRVAFNNSWINLGAGNDVCGFHRRLDGVVESRGWAKSGTSAVATVWTYPVGFRSSIPKTLFAAVTGPAAGLATIDSAFSIKHVVGNVLGQSFNGVMHRAEA